MEMLETALAFSVAMILFSSIVAGLVEATLRALSRRASLVRRGVESLIAEVEEKGLVPSALEGLEPRDRKALVDELTLNRMADPNPPPLRWWMPTDWFTALLVWLGIFDRSDRNRVETLSSLGFAMRLIDTDIGKATTFQGYDPEAARHGTLQPLPTNPDDVRMSAWSDLVRRYARYRALTNEEYRRSARTWSIAMALIFALAFNIDAGRLVTHLWDNAQARDALTGSAAELVERLDLQAEQLEAVVDSSDAEGASGDGEGSGNGEGGEAGAGTGTDAPQAPPLEQLADAIEDTSNELAQYAEANTLPVGFGYRPHCEAAFLQTDCVVVEDDESGFTLGVWVINALIAGLLVGLGGPFWYRVFAGLSNLATLLRSAGGGNVPSEVLSTGTSARDGTDVSLEAEVAAVVEAVMNATNVPTRMAAPPQAARATPTPATS